MNYYELWLHLEESTVSQVLKQKALKDGSVNKTMSAIESLVKESIQ